MRCKRACRAPGRCRTARTCRMVAMPWRSAVLDTQSSLPPNSASSLPTLLSGRTPLDFSLDALWPLLAGRSPRPTHVCTQMKLGGVSWRGGGTLATRLIKIDRWRHARKGPLPLCGDTCCVTLPRSC